VTRDFRRRSVGLIAVLAVISVLGVINTSRGLAADPPTTAPPLPPVRPAGPVFYVSPTGSDAAAGTSPAAAWQSIARVQQALDSGIVTPGATVSFQRSSRFPGSLRLTGEQSGTASAPITFAAHGAGASPVLDGGSTLTAWSAAGANLWTATCTNCSGRPAGLSIDGAPQPLARFPNADEGDGYRYYQTFSGRRTITDTSLTQNWVGAELAVRSIAWVIDRQPIVSQSGGTLTIGADTSYDLQAGYGYFIQDHPGALDRAGEWTYNPATKTITLFSATDPRQRNVAVTNSELVMSLNGSRNIVMKDLTFRGGQQGNVNAENCQNVKLVGIVSGHSGGTGIRFVDCSNASIASSQVTDAQDIGIDAQYCANCSVTNSVIKRIAILSGMGLGADGHYLGARIGGPNGLFEGNSVDGIGYIGVDVRGTATVRRNVIRDFNRVKVDGGGVYTYENADVVITDNIVTDAPGSTAGIPWTTRSTHGIYIDDNSERVVVSGNTVARVGGAGVLLHNANNVTVEGNTIAGTGEAGFLLADDDLGSFSVTGLKINNNTVVSDTPDVHVLDAFTRTAVPNTGFLSNLGEISNNRYCGVFERASFRSADSTGETITDLAGWQALSGRDGGSAVCPTTRPIFAVSSETGPQRVENGAFASNIEPWFGWPEEALVASWDVNGISGGSLRFLNNGQNNRVHIDAPTDALTAGQTYRIRFKARSNTVGKTIQVYLRQREDPYESRTRIATVPLGASASQYEFFLPALQSETASLLLFQLDQANAPVWLDDVTVQAVQGRTVTSNEIMRVETNPANSPRAVVLDATYTDVSGAMYPAGATVTIPPLRSTVLLRAG
jgi:hypothetical protein